MACHNQLFAPNGADVSIGLDWRPSAMANSARDPYWRAAVRREVLDHPGARAEVVNYVLHPPREDETPLISQAIERSLEVWPLIFAGEMEKAMHRLHTNGSVP